MNKGWIGYALLGALFYAIFLIAIVPAGWLAWGLARATQGVVVLGAPLGSIWSGRAEMVLHRAPDPPQRVGKLKWTINPLWLVTARLGIGAVLDAPGGGEAQLHARVGLASVRVTELSANLPAQQLALWYSPLALASPSGQLRVTSNGLDIHRDALRGDAEVIWQDAGVSLSSVQPLGSYRLTVSAQGPSADLKIETTGGDLELAGQGTFQAQTRSLNLSGFATAKARQSELETLLQLIGPDQGDGRRAWSISR